MDLVLSRKGDASGSLDLSNFDIIFRCDEEIDFGEQSSEVELNISYEACFKDEYKFPHSIEGENKL